MIEKFRSWGFWALTEIYDISNKNSIPKIFHNSKSLDRYEAKVVLEVSSAEFNMTTNRNEEVQFRCIQLDDIRKL